MLIRGATVVSMDAGTGDLAPGDVLVRDGRIAAVGTGLAGEDTDVVVDGTGCVLVPGFVDTHRHMWEGAFRGAVPGGTLDDYFRRMLLDVAPALTPADLAVSEAVSARASVTAGITTVQDTSDIHDSPERTDAIVGALQDSGLRVVFAYGLARTVLLRDGSALPDDVRRVRSERLADDDALVTMALSTSHGDDDAERHNAALARDLGVRTAHHVRPAITPSRLRDLGALVPGTTFVHGNGLSAGELAVMAEAGGSLSIAPVVEMALGLGHPMVGEALATPGLPITLSVDVEVTGPTDMFSAMRAAYLQARLDGAGATPHDVLGWATLGGAQALGLGARTGSITPGKAADLVLLRADRLDASPVADPAGTVVLQMDRAHVDTVLVGGTVHVRAGRPVRDDGPLIEQARSLAARFR